MFHRKHNRVRFSCGDELVTKQSFKAECDINNILKQYSKTGVINHVQSARPTYDDLPDAIDYQQSLNTLMEADQAFAGLPASVRNRFGNSPAAFLDALGDPAQEDYLREIGVLRPAEPVQALPDPVRPPPTSPEPKAS